MHLSDVWSKFEPIYSFSVKGWNLNFDGYQRSYILALLWSKWMNLGLECSKLQLIIHLTLMNSKWAQICRFKPEKYVLLWCRFYSYIKAQFWTPHLKKVGLFLFRVGLGTNEHDLSEHWLYENIGLKISLILKAYWNAIKWLINGFFYVFRPEKPVFVISNDMFEPPKLVWGPRTLKMKFWDFQIWGFWKD